MIALLLILPITEILSADKIFCSTCESEIKPGKEYIISNGFIFCSPECYEKNLPKCEVCGNPVKQGFIQNGKSYCSELCLKTTWGICSVCGKRVNSGVHFGSKDGVFYCTDCSKLPVCFACGLPGNCIKLSDGRSICPLCKSRSVTSFRKALDIVRSVRKLIKTEFELHTDHEISYEIVDSEYLKSKSNNTESELGLYYHENRIKTRTVSKNISGFEYGKQTYITEKDSFVIFLISDLPEEKLIEVAAHELGHDWMEKNYPLIKDKKIIEGWAEYIASLVNIYHGNSYLNRRMEENISPVYGDGYRYISNYVNKYGLSELYELFEQLNNEGAE